MSLPFYVSPEQLMQDKAEYARKGISRGKSIVTLEFDGGILLIAENPSRSLSKIGEIYDRVAFAGVGKFSEFDQLRKVGVRYADTRGYAYSRDDVRAKALANAYSQVIGEVFTREMKPLEVEIVVAEVGDPRFVGHEENALYRVRYDGSINDEKGFCVIGGTADQLESHLQSSYRPGMDLRSAIRVARDALGRAENGDPGLGSQNLEVCLLERQRVGRKFRRLGQDEVRGLLS
jgi:proteasome alpha subunit